MSETLHIDPELAARADVLFRELGLDLSTAVQLFLLQSLREHGLPFTPRLTASACRHGSMPENTASAPSHPESSRAPVQTDASGTTEEAERQNEPSPQDPPADAGTVQDGQEVDDAGDEKNETVSPQSADDENGPFPQSCDDDGRHEDGGELRQAFLNARLIGASLRRVRSLNRLYSIGEPNAQVQGWREVYVSGDEPFALDFGAVRVELGFHGGGSLRMMDGRLPDSVLEADAVYPRDLSAVFSSVIGQRLVDVSSGRIWNEGHEREQLCLRFANGCTLNFAPGGEWGALWLTDAHGAVMFAPEAVWLRVLDDRTRNGLR